MIGYALVFLTLVAVAMGNGAGHGPQTLSACIAMKDNTTMKEDRKAKMQAFKTCAAKCFTATGRTASPQKACFEAAHAKMQSVFQSNKSKFQALRPALESCYTKDCSATPLPKSTHAPKAAGAGKGHGAYNASNPHEQDRCAMKAIHELAKQPKQALSDAQKTTLHTCVKACFPAHPSEEKPKATSAAKGTEGKEGKGGKGGKHHGHKRRHHDCIHEFCTKEQVEACASSAGLKALHDSLKPEIQKEMAAEYTATCTCLKAHVEASAPAYIKSLDCSALPSAAVCTQIWADEEAEHAAWKAKKAAAKTTSG